MRRTAGWHRVRSKVRKAEGKQYINSKGNFVPDKKPPGEILCSLRCRLQCSEKLSVEDRTSIFHQFHSLDTNQKNCYLFSSIEPRKPVVQRVSANRHRQLSFWYHITVNRERLHICKCAFAKIHQITFSKVDHLLTQIRSGSSVAKEDQRGKHHVRPNRKTEDEINSVIHHIELFPAEQSHYSRSQNSNRMYLSPLLSVTKMYDAYVQWCKSENIYKPVSDSYYREIFATRFNYGFGCPRSDTCGKCDMGGDNEEHKSKADQAFTQQKKDKEVTDTSNSSHFITFDLQKTMPLPKLSTGIAFYLRQLWVYNLGIHLHSKNQKRAFFQTWTENEAGRGCEEIGSCILAFLDAAPAVTGHLTAWSDSCSGQNKNFFIICLWQYLVSTGRFKIIEQKFPESGHSYLDSDRDFALVEKEIKKRENITSVDEYYEILTSSQKKAPPRVTRMGGKFISLKDLPKIMNLSNTLVNTDGEKVAFRDRVRWIRVRQVGEYSYRNSFDLTEPWKRVVIGSHSSGIDLPFRVQKSRPIAEKKLSDIRKQLPYIPLSHRQFFLTLCSEGNEDSDITDKEDGDGALSNTSEIHGTRNNYYKIM